MIRWVGFFGIVDSIVGKMGESFGGGVAFIWWKNFNRFPSSVRYRPSAGTRLVCETFRRAEKRRVLMLELRCIMSMLPSSHCVAVCARSALLADIGECS
jgi:hypothetical protein